MHCTLLCDSLLPQEASPHGCIIFLAGGTRARLQSLVGAYGAWCVAHTASGRKVAHSISCTGRDAVVLPCAPLLDPCLLLQEVESASA